MAAGLAGALAAPNLFAYTGLDGTINFWSFHVSKW